ncbi:hypothetical protein Tco_0415704 [Tanacetum coccineum]
MLRLKENHVGWIVVVLGGDDLSSIDDGGGGRAALEADAFLAAGDECSDSNARLVHHSSKSSHAAGSVSQQGILGCTSPITPIVFATATIFID